jgi:hypothetical protein
MIFKSRSKLVLFVLILAAIIFLPLLAHALTFQYGKAITIDHAKVLATLTNFPVLVSISNDNDLKNHVTSGNGYDLVFSDGSGSQLDHEIEPWDGSTGSLVAWVRIPTLSSTTDTVISLWYGNSGVTTSQENKTGVWDVNFKGAWQAPNGSNLTVNRLEFSNSRRYGATAC